MTVEITPVVASLIFGGEPKELIQAMSKRPNLRGPSRMHDAPLFAPAVRRYP
jgi:hypothetical protein